MWYIQSNLIFYGLTISFHRSKEVFVCSLIVSLRCVFWVALSIRGGGIDSPRPASQRAAAFILTAAMLITLTAPAFAGTWYIEDGDITVKASGTEGKNKVSQGANQEVEDTDTIITNREDKASSNTVTIEAEKKDDKVEVTLKDVNIEATGDKAAVSVTGSGDTTIKLDGDSHLTGGSDDYSGSGISSSGSLTISGGENDSLTAKGGSGKFSGSGISSDSLTITGGTVNATGGSSSGSQNGGYGIHSGSLTISGSTVNATGGDGSNKNASSGGSGISSSGSLTVSDSTVTANGGNGGSARGSHGGNGIDSGSLTISGGTVTANGGDCSKYSNRSNGGSGIYSGSLSVSDGTVTATGGDGGGDYSDGGSGIYSGSGGVTISGATVNAAGGDGGGGDYSDGGSGIYSSNSSSLTISGGTVKTTGGNGNVSGGCGIYNSGSLIISDGTVNATGGNGKDSYGGYGISGRDVAISGGTVTANGGDSKDGYGGSGISSSSDIDLSGSLELTAKAGKGNRSNGKALSQKGSELDLNAIKDKLGPGANIVTKDADGSVINQVSIPRPVEPEEPVIPEESSSSDGGSAAPSAPASPLPGLTVTDKDGQRISYTSTQSGNTLTVCVGRLTASFRISLAALRQLRAEGIDTITFQTILCSTTLSVDELLAMGGEDAEAVLTHRFTDSSLTVG